MFTIILLAASVHLINLIKMHVIKKEKKKTLKVVAVLKFRFHKLLKNYIQRWFDTVKTHKCFFEIE